MRKKYLYSRPFRTKKKKEPNVFSVFSLFFKEKKQFSKTKNNEALNLKKSSLLLLSSKEGQVRRVCCFNQCHEGKIFIQQAFQNKKEKMCSPCFPCFSKQKTVFKNYKQPAPKFEEFKSTASIIKRRTKKKSLLLQPIP